MTRKMGTCIVTVLIAATATYAMPIEFWTGGEAGQGLNEAILVLDFNPGESYAFGYRWTGDAKGYDMLDGLAGASGGTLSYTYTDWGGTLGYAIDSITYDGLTMGAGDYPSDWCAYFTSLDGSTWDEASTGVSYRELDNGDWDGWSQQSEGYPASSVPPVTPVPEPSAMALFVLGGGVAWLRMRRNAARSRAEQVE